MGVDQGGLSARVRLLGGGARSARARSPPPFVAVRSCPADRCLPPLPLPPSHARSLVQAMSVLGMKKAGPQLGKVLAVAVDWQLAHPAGHQRRLHRPPGSSGRAPVVEHAFQLCPDALAAARGWEWLGGGRAPRGARPGANQRCTPLRGSPPVSPCPNDRSERPGISQLHGIVVAPLARRARSHRHRHRSRCAALRPEEETRCVVRCWIPALRSCVGESTESITALAPSYACMRYRKLFQTPEWFNRRGAW